MSGQTALKFQNNSINNKCPETYRKVILEIEVSRIPLQVLSNYSRFRDIEH